MVCILLAPGFEESEAIVPADLLRRAGIEVQLAAVQGMEVTSSHGICVRADVALSDVQPDCLEALFLPGGLQGVENIRNSPEAVSLIRQAHEKGIYLTAICAAPTIRGGLGFLDGRRAVCYPGMEAGLEKADVQTGTPVVADGRLLTGEAAGSAFPFALKMIELLRGPEAAQAVRTAVHYHG